MEPTWQARDRFQETAKRLATALDGIDRFEFLEMVSVLLSSKDWADELRAQVHALEREVIDLTRQTEELEGKVEELENKS